jgi:3-phosphoglycerate kinase
MIDIESVSLKKSKVLLRVDFNVPMSGATILDDKRILAALPTIKFLMDKHEKIVICSHFGRPKGKIDEHLSLKPISDYLEKLLKIKIEFLDIFRNELNTIYEKYHSSKNKMFMLENLRYDEGEEKNNDKFSKMLSQFGEIYVSDAFGTSHRKHSSTYGVTNYIPGYAGFLIKSEYQIISNIMNKPLNPLIVIIGGAKISTKLELIKNFVNKADTIILGGGLANTFLTALGHNLGNSLIENDMLKIAKEILYDLEKSKTKLILPKDFRISRSFSEDWIVNQKAKIIKLNEFGNEGMVLDIGPETQKIIKKIITEANSIIWNGPLGVIEKEHYSIGSKFIANEIINTNTPTIIGGGETAYVISMITEKIPSNIHVSTGGGATLELLSGKNLPGLICLNGKKR